MNSLSLAAAILSAITFAPVDSKPLRVVIIDGQNNHNWRATTPIIKRGLEGTGRFTVDVSTNLKLGDTKPGEVSNPVAFPPDLSKYDVVLSNYNGLPWPEQFNKSLADRVREGQVGLVVFHAADNAFTGWPEFNAMIGMGWRNNKFGDRIFVNAEGKEVRQPKGDGLGAGETSLHAFKVTVRDAEHPITKGMPREWLHAPDQLVHGLRGPIENVHVLATAYSDKSKKGTGEHEPSMWTIAYGKGRVYHTPMGHGLDSVRCLGFLTGLSRGCVWVATGSVTLPVPNTFPTADQTSLLSEKLREP